MAVRDPGALNVGVENAFDFHCYKALPVSFASRGNDLVKCTHG